MRRSPLLTALLIVYPIVIAVLIGFALSRGPDKPRVAFLNEVPTDTPFEIGGEDFDLVGARSELCSRIECVRVESEEEARDLVESGEVLGALILPADLIDDLQSLGGLDPGGADRPGPRQRGGPGQGEPRRRPDHLAAVGGEPADLPEGLRGLDELPADPPRGRRLLVPRRRPHRCSGSRPSEEILQRRPRRAAARTARRVDGPRRGDPLQPARRREPRRRRRPARLRLAADQVEKEVVSGDAPSLDTFAISVAATITLMFVTVLLVAGSLALEREENAFARLTRGLVGKSALLAEKVLLGRRRLAASSRC